MDSGAAARFGGLWATDLDAVTDDLRVLEGSGRWAVVLPYDGPPILARFRRWGSRPAVAAGEWLGPTPTAWTSSMDRSQYVSAVERARAAIVAGTIYQVNVCRILSATLPDPQRVDVAALDALVSAGNPAPFGGFVRLPQADLHLVSASPELFLRVDVTDTRRRISSGPIKGTARTADGMSDKDRAENVMIVDLMRNDLSRVCRTGSVEVPALLRIEEHPGLVHLVSDIAGDLRPEVDWAQIIDATFPPGSVTGAPKSTSLTAIRALESADRGPYCGAVGWVDADTGEGELAVTIRSFWRTGDTVHFGTGAGITWGSDPQREWNETQLKAERLIGLASGRFPAHPHGGMRT